MIRSILTLAAIALTATPAAAQDEPHPMRGRLGVGVSIGRAQPASPQLSGRAAIGFSAHRLPARGAGVAFAFHWFNTGVDETFADTDVAFGRLAIRPVMAGVGYTAVRGRLAISPSFVAGPALATLRVDDRLADRFAVAGSDFEQHVGRVTLAMRAGVTTTYAIAPRLGLTGFAGYLWSRPSFTITTPGGPVRKDVRADAALVGIGVAVWLF